MKNRTTFEKFPRTNAGRSKNWKTLRALCLLLFLSVSFTAYSQITVNVKDISLRASLKKIEQVSNYKFFYNENLPELNQKVSLNVQNATIQQVMKQLLGKMELTYKQEQENIIVLIRKEQEKKRNINVSGTVVDEKGEPVIGASVTVVGTALGTITNLEGKYSLTDVQEDSKVAISFVGYGALTFSAKDKQLARVVLKEDSELLDREVVPSRLRRVHVRTKVRRSTDGRTYHRVIPDRLLREECQEFMSNKQVEHRVAIHRFLSEVLEPLVPEVHLWLL